MKKIAFLGLMAAAHITLNPLFAIDNIERHRITSQILPKLEKGLQDYRNRQQQLLKLIEGKRWFKPKEEYSERDRSTVEGIFDEIKVLFSELKYLKIDFKSYVFESAKEKRTYNYNNWTDSIAREHHSSHFVYLETANDESKTEIARKLEFDRSQYLSYVDLENADNFKPYVTIPLSAFDSNPDILKSEYFTRYPEVTVIVGIDKLNYIRNPPTKYGNAVVMDPAFLNDTTFEGLALVDVRDERSEIISFFSRPGFLKNLVSIYGDGREKQIETYTNKIKFFDIYSLKDCIIDENTAQALIYLEEQILPYSIQLYPGNDSIDPIHISPLLKSVQMPRLSYNIIVRSIDIPKNIKIADLTFYKSFSTDSFACIARSKVETLIIRNELKVNPSIHSGATLCEGRMWDKVKIDREKENHVPLNLIFVNPDDDFTLNDISGEWE